MIDDKSGRPIIIIKRVKKKKAEHHGGSWKIAYADFVTAMMAFFLLMWLLSMLNKYQLMGISNYFNKPARHVYVDNQNNDTKEEKVPAEQTKKYKMVMTSKENVPLDARSRGSTSNKNQTDEVDQKNASKLNEQAEQSKPEEVADEEDRKKLMDFMKKLQNDLVNQRRVHEGQLSFQMMEDGLKIDLRDLKNKPMFSNGKADFEQYARHALVWLSRELTSTNRKIVIIGHTDNRPYAPGAKYTNWELSADRANAARRALIKYGMPADKIVMIQAFAAEKPKVPDYVNGDINRRIEIMVLTDKALKKLLKKDE